SGSPHHLLVFSADLSAGRSTSSFPAPVSRTRPADMTRDQLEHVIRAAAAIAGVTDIVVIGSQSILGAYPNAPEALLVSQEADVYPMQHPERGDLIDGSIG